MVLEMSSKVQEIDPSFTVRKSLRHQELLAALFDQLVETISNYKLENETLTRRNSQLRREVRELSEDFKAKKQQSERITEIIDAN